MGVSIWWLMDERNLEISCFSSKLTTASMTFGSSSNFIVALACNVTQERNKNIFLFLGLTT